MTDDHERAALLRAVCESPADDLPRLIYCDWLDDHGESAQATYIRMELDTAANPGSLRHALTANSLQPAFPFVGLDPVWKRGFVEIITCTVEFVTCDSLPWLLARHPIQQINLEARWPASYSDGTAGWTIGDGFSGLPLPIWERLSNFVRRTRTKIAIYEGIRAARYEAGQACLSYGRERSGWPADEPSKVRS